MNFSTRLKEEIEYNGMQYKELAAKADVKLRALFTYVAEKPSMPPADVAVRIAKALNVSVEYLVEGKTEDEDIHHKQTVNLINSFDRLSNIEQKAIMQLIETLRSQNEQ